MVPCVLVVKFFPIRIPDASHCQAIFSRRKSLEIRSGRGFQKAEIPKKIFWFLVENHLFDLLVLLTQILRTEQDTKREQATFPHLCITLWKTKIKI
jgi:hypothetical protein